MFARSAPADQKSDARSDRVARPRRAAWSGVDVQDRLAALAIRGRDEQLAIEAARSQQGRVEILQAVRRAHDDDLVARGEAVELDQQLVKRLVVLAVEAAATTSGADRVELVDEDDGGRMLPRLGEELPDASRPRPANISTNADALWA